ncbi:hypothetical protein E8E11_004888 [Didymella keratinophila]|nr:hypothetical protein E8E11_004888 [Didymella keratinophila]
MSEFLSTRLRYESECNTIGWALAALNPHLDSNPGLLKRAVEGRRNFDSARSKSRRVIRMVKMRRKPSDASLSSDTSEGQGSLDSMLRPLSGALGQHRNGSVSTVSSVDSDGHLAKPGQCPDAKSTYPDAPLSDLERLQKEIRELPPPSVYLQRIHERERTAVDTSLEDSQIEDRLDLGYRRADDDDELDKISVISRADSIWSVASLATTATVVSAASGYSVAQIDCATKELLHIFLEDKGLVPLYLTAIQRANIGAQRLQRNVRRLLKGFAPTLQSEASQELEVLAARLVALKAAYVARSIVERYEVNLLLDLPPKHNQPHDLYRDEDDSDQDQETEEGTLDEVVDEDLIEDLFAFRKFLVEGEAFATLRRKLESFVLPKQVENQGYPLAKTPLQLDEQASRISVDRRTHMESDLLGTHTYRKILGRGRETLATLPVAVGILEPPLNFGWVRLRWQCRCGESLFGDVKEYRPGGAQALVEQMHRSTGAKVAVTSYSKTFTNQNWVFRVPRMVRRLTSNLSSKKAGTSDSEECLPQHNGASQAAPSTGATTNVTAPPSSSLHLLACFHLTQRRKCLLQDHVDAVSTDQALFSFIKQQLQRNRSRIRSIFTMRSVQGMFFVKFRLRMGNVVEVRDHNPCCTSTNPNTCECIPPVTKVEPSPDAEYRCSPAGPLATWPPVLSQDLMHMLSSPQCINENETWVLEQLPKRIAGELQERPGQPIEGWGVYYQEAIDFDIIITVVFIVFLMASLLFGILWTRFEMDIQGAFGVSSYMITAIGILLAMIASRAKNFG